jgi:hypothetical protein
LSAQPVASLDADGPVRDLSHALASVAAGANERDRTPRFPADGFEALAVAGVPQLAGERERCDLTTEVALIRAVAAADASCGRILDGHFNGVERLAMNASRDLRERELEAVRAGELLLGVWGADPAPGEGFPARVENDAAGNLVMHGVKTFCSGVGGVQRALVIARDSSGARRLAYVDVTARVHIDRSWYRASGLRSSESHRVEFTGTTVLALLGGEDELLRDPWLSRDSVRTASTWAGIADCLFQATVDALSDRTPDAVSLHALGEMRLALGATDRWLQYTVAAISDVETPLVAGEGVRGLASECRVALAQAARLISAHAARLAGSRTLVSGGTLDRARRDLDLFLLQHRLDPKLVELGERALQEPPS